MLPCAYSRHFLWSFNMAFKCFGVAWMVYNLWQRDTMALAEVSLLVFLCIPGSDIAVAILDNWYESNMYFNTSVIATFKAWAAWDPVDDIKCKQHWMRSFAVSIGFWDPINSAYCFCFGVILFIWVLQSVRPHLRPPLRDHTNSHVVIICIFWSLILTPLFI